MNTFACSKSSKEIVPGVSGKPLLQAFFTRPRLNTEDKVKQTKRNYTRVSCREPVDGNSEHPNTSQESAFYAALRYMPCRKKEGATAADRNPALVQWLVIEGHGTYPPDIVNPTGAA